MYRAFAEVAEVPPGVVTVTSTGEPVATPAGIVAVTCVALTTATLVADAMPKLTTVVSVRLVPVTVTEVPPAAGP